MRPVRALLLSAALTSVAALALFLVPALRSPAAPAPELLGLVEIDQAFQKMVVNGYKVEVGARGVRLSHAAAGEIYVAEHLPLHLALHNCVLRAQERDAAWKKFRDDEDAARGFRNR